MSLWLYQRFTIDYLYPEWSELSNFNQDNRELRFTAVFVSKEGTEYETTFNNTESLYHAIKYYVYYLLEDSFLFSRFTEIIGNINFRTNPQESWEDSRKNKFIKVYYLYECICNKY